MFTAVDVLLDLRRYCRLDAAGDPVVEMTVKSISAALTALAKPDTHGKFKLHREKRRVDRRVRAFFHLTEDGRRWLHDERERVRRYIDHLEHQATVLRTLVLAVEAGQSEQG